MRIGLLMIRGEDDVLAATLTANSEFVDAFYVLDGTEPNEASKAICISHPKCHRYTTDGELPDGYPQPARDGCRQHLYEQAASDHGRNNWFLLLHGDEVWTGLPPLDTGEDGFMFLLPFYFPRAGEEWDSSRAPLEQLRWHLGPGYPELRMFLGAEHVNYHPAQHASVHPNGLTKIGSCDAPIKHYLYRSPEAQRERARDRIATGFDSANYVHVANRDAVYWTDEMIADYRQKDHGYFRDLACENA